MNQTISGARRILPRYEYDKTLLLSIAFSVALTLARVAYTGTTLFLFLGWNLVLAILPYLLTRVLSQHPRWSTGTRNFILISLVWLFWIPNAFYILTDLFHLGWSDQMPKWFDLALILSYAWNGLLLGLLSVRQMEKLWQARFPAVKEGWFIIPVMFLNAWGVYIGRFLRFNTWDLITNPFRLLADICTMLIHPVANKYAWGMVLCYAALMTIMYMTLKKMSKAIH